VAETARPPIRRAVRWLVCVGRRARPRARLICVPYAGAATAAFRDWPASLPDWLEVWAVQPPGRESRLAEPPVTDLPTLVESITAAMGTDLPGGEPLPYALYGHSMGALVGFELAHAIPAAGHPPPAAMFVSGRRAPQIPDRLPSIHRLPRDEFLAQIQRLNGIPDAVLAEPGLLDLVLPNVAGDFAVIEPYVYRPRPRLACGISAFGGDADPTTAPEQVRAWREQTTGRFRMHIWPGDHFFINPHRDALLRALADDLGEASA